MSAKLKKKLVFDTETTGLDPVKTHIHQLSGLVLDEQDNILERFDWSFRPFSLDNFEDESCSVNGISREVLAARTKSSKEVFIEFVDLLDRHCNRFDKKDKLIPIGYNIKFDMEFLRQFFVVHGDSFFGSYFWIPGFCVMYTASALLMDYRHEYPNFKLNNVCRAASIEWDESQAHDSMYDVDKTYEVYLKLKELLPR